MTDNNDDNNGKQFEQKALMLKLLNKHLESIEKEELVFDDDQENFLEEVIFLEKDFRIEMEKFFRERQVRKGGRRSHFHKAEMEQDQANDNPKEVQMEHGIAIGNPVNVQMEHGIAICNPDVQMEHGITIGNPEDVQIVFDIAKGNPDEVQIEQDELVNHNPVEVPMENGQGSATQMQKPPESNPNSVQNFLQYYTYE